MKPVRFHPDAEAELFDAIVSYEEQRAGRGRSFREAVENAIDAVRRSPEMLPTRGLDGVRGCTVRRFPYTVHYAEFGSEIWIVAIAHHRRRPGYWEKRSPE